VFTAAERESRGGVVTEAELYLQRRKNEECFSAVVVCVSTHLFANRIVLFQKCESTDAIYDILLLRRAETGACSPGRSLITKS
jgi:hypothetical protein